MRPSIAFLSGVAAAAPLVWRARSHLASAEANALALNAELTDSQVRLQQTARAGGVAFWQRRVGDESERLSPEFAAMLGYPSDFDELTTAHFHPDDRAAMIAMRASDREAEQGDRTTLLRVLGADGTYRWIRSTSAVVDRDGERVRLGTSVDVTAEREREAELERLNAELRRTNESLSDFTRVASHDLRSPLRAIRSLAGFLREDTAGQLDGPSLAHLSEIESRVDGADRLLNDLLRYAQSDSGEHTVEPTDVQRVISETLAAAHVPSGLESSARCEVGCVRVAPVPLATCIRNLVDNACKHHPGPTGHVNIIAHSDANTLTVEVSDDGAGIESRYHEQIFEPFRTLQPASSADSSGVGLSIVRRIAQAHGGSISVASDGLNGATFSLTWPIEHLDPSR